MRPIEMLESRTLFAATLSQTLLTDLSNLTSDVSAAKTTYAQYAPTLHADLEALRTDAKAAGQRADGVLVAKLTAASLHFFNVTKAEAARVFVADRIAATSGTADALLLSLHPTNTRLQARFTASLGRLNTIAGNLLNKLGNDGESLSAASGAAVDAVNSAYSANAAVTSDVAKLQSDGSAFLTSLGSSLGAIESDLPQFLSDVISGN